MPANLVATGSYLPEREIPNDVMRERFREVAPTFVDKVEAKSGILTRWAAPDDWATSDLALRAAEDCLARAGVDAADLDLIVVGTDSPDYVTPSTSVVLQQKLGATRAGTFDVGCACASFPTAVASAAGMLATNPWMTRILVVGAYLMRKLSDPTDPMSFFYGDGAGAALLTNDGPGLLSTAFRADGNYAKAWCIASGGTAEPASEESVRAGRTQVRLLDAYPSAVNENGWPVLVRDLASRGGFAIDDIDVAIFTQVRRNTIQVVADRLGLPLEKCPMVMDRIGYTGSACIPMALHDTLARGGITPGQLVILVGSGVGYNQAAVAFRASEALCEAAAPR